MLTQSDVFFFRFWIKILMLKSTMLQISIKVFLKRNFQKLGISLQNRELNDGLISLKHLRRI